MFSQVNICNGLLRLGMASRGVQIFNIYIYLSCNSHNIILHGSAKNPDESCYYENGYLFLFYLYDVRSKETFVVKWLSQQTIDLPFTAFFAEIYRKSIFHLSPKKACGECGKILLAN